MYVASFEEFTEEGTKASNIASLFRKGFPVPKGFVITKEMYNKFLEYNNIRPNAEDVLNSQIPDFLVSDIRKQYEDLSIDIDMRAISGKALDLISVGRGQPAVAVRGEGNFKLHVQGLSQLQDAIKEAWSLGSEEVIVQKMLDSEKSGILSPHPTKEATMIESSWGLAFPGGINPDLFIATSEGITVNPGKKEWLLKKDVYSEQVVRSPVPVDSQEAVTLSESEIQNLLDVKKKAEEAFSSPLRIEFAFQRGKIWILQADTVDKRLIDPPETEGSLILKGEVIVPGFVRGRVRKISSTEDVEMVEAGDIIVAETIHPDYLKTRCSGLITQKCSLHRLGKVVSLPALRTATISPLVDGDYIFLDAVAGGIYKIQQSPPAPVEEHVPEVSETPVTESGIRIKASLTSPHQEIPESDGIVIRAEHILADKGHPSVLARESPEETSRFLEETLGALARKIFPKSVWYRSFDGRSDELHGLDGSEEREANPLLGWHGTRKALEDAVFTCELEALRRLYDKGLYNVTLLLPFVSTVEEFKHVRDKATFPLKIGISIETPAAALSIEEFCKEGIFAVQVDLDALTQLTLGMDADNPRFSHHFSSLDPSVEQLASRTLETCKKFRVETSVQGEALNNPETSIQPEAVTTSPDNMENIRRLFGNI